MDNRSDSYSTDTQENNSVEDALDSDDDNNNNNGEYNLNSSEQRNNYRETRRRVNKPINLMKDARRLFLWTAEQLEAVEELYYMLEAKYGTENDNHHNERLVACMLRFYKTFICFQFAGSEFESGLVHFIAVLGIDKDSNKL